MKDLIERLEKATGPDRELDYAITFEVDRDRFEWCDRTRADLQRAAAANGLAERDEACRRSAFDACRSFTASIDAAVTLAPADAAVTPTIGGPYAMARISLAPKNGECWTQAPMFRCDRAANGAIAICIAALKARSAVERDLTESNNG